MFSLSTAHQLKFIRHLQADQKKNNKCDTDSTRLPEDIEKKLANLMGIFFDHSELVDKNSCLANDKTPI